MRGEQGLDKGKETKRRVGQEGISEKREGDIDEGEGNWE